MLPQNIRKHVALAFGVAVLVMVYRVGRIHGVYFNTALTFAIASDQPGFNAVESGSA